MRVVVGSYTVVLGVDYEASPTALRGHPASPEAVRVLPVPPGFPSRFAFRWPRRARRLPSARNSPEFWSIRAPGLSSPKRSTALGERTPSFRSPVPQSAVVGGCPPPTSATVATPVLWISGRMLRMMPASIAGPSGS
jgi:hypothetical protein